MIGDEDVDGAESGVVAVVDDVTDPDGPDSDLPVGTMRRHPLAFRRPVLPALVACAARNPTEEKRREP